VGGPGGGVMAPPPFRGGASPSSGDASVRTDAGGRRRGGRGREGTRGVRPRGSVASAGQAARGALVRTAAGHPHEEGQSYPCLFFCNTHFCPDCFLASQHSIIR